MPDQEKNIKDILETVNFIKDNAASKSDLMLFATKEEILDLKNDFKDLREGFNNLQTAVDNYAKRAETIFEELVAMNVKLNRHERWIQQIAKKLEINLDY